ncbi:MAG: 2-amino-4-hydroxy-6-hydroxymethyldihydropteridine diphosphokinase [Actinomycetota bacterium]
MSDAPRIFVGLGSNLGDRLTNLRQALALMSHKGVIVNNVSSVYETEPVGPPQPNYLNAVCEVETHLRPQGLLVSLKTIEKEMGRAPAERWGPRSIDLDILLYGDQTIDSLYLKVPHKELLNRTFMLIPLHELAPDLLLPTGVPVSPQAPVRDPGVTKTPYRLNQQADPS